LFQTRQDFSRPAQSTVGPQKYFAITVVGVFEHLLLLFERPAVLGNDGRKSFHKARDGRLPGIGFAFLTGRHVDDEPPYVIAPVDWGVGVDNNVAALGALIAMTARRPDAHLHPGDRRAQHVMRVLTVDDVISQIIFEEGWLPVTTGLADGPYIVIALAGPFVELDRDPAILDIADVAVVEGVEMRDVEQVLDQQQRVGGHRHRSGIGRFPYGVGNLRQARRPDGLGFARIAGPHPDEAVLLDDRKRTQPRLRRDAAVGMRRHPYAATGRIIAQAVIRAFEQVAFDQPAL
jgi:hypothetical protein